MDEDKYRNFNTGNYKEENCDPTCKHWPYLILEVLKMDDEFFYIVRNCTNKDSIKDSTFTLVTPEQAIGLCLLYKSPIPEMLKDAYLETIGVLNVN